MQSSTSARNAEFPCVFSLKLGKEKKKKKGVSVAINTLINTLVFF